MGFKSFLSFLVRNKFIKFSSILRLKGPKFNFNLPSTHNSLIYLIEGEVKVGEQNHDPVKDSTLIILTKGEKLKVKVLEIKKDSQKANIAYKLNRTECIKYLKLIQNRNYKAMQNFFNKKREPLLYMSSLVNFIVNRIK